MASSLEFVEYVVSQLSDCGLISYKRMFGEYGIYCDGIYFGAICNNNFLVKITDKGKEIKDFNTGYPYEGAKPMFLIEDLDDKEVLAKLVEITCNELTKKSKK